MMDPIVSAEWLTEHYKTVIVCDARAYLDGRDAKAIHREGHLPGAVFVDLETVLSGPPAGVAGRHPLPNPDQFADDLGSLGISANASVVAYDDAAGAFASRLVWMLRAIDQEAAILDGGIDAWDGELETGGVDRTPAERLPVPWPTELLATANQVAAHITNGGVVIDSRAAPRFLGEEEPIDPRVGHVPGAVNLPFAGNLGHNGRFLSPADLSTRFRSVGAAAEAIVYCGSGVTACHNALAMEAAGLGVPRLYVGSWSGWSSDPDRPVAVGSTPPTEAPDSQVQKP